MLNYCCPYRSDDRQGSQYVDANLGEIIIIPPMPSLVSSPPTSETIVAPSDEMIDKVHDAGDASVIENITDTPRPSLTVGAIGETISYQMCNYGIHISQNCSRLTKFIVHSVIIYVCK